MTHDDDNSSTNKIWLRIIQVNDVYELENFPHFKTLVDKNKHGPDKTLVILAGNFLGPSQLSSLDKGRGMVDTMNACRGITHAAFGNHEADVPMLELAKWVMADLKFA
jgi:5'-nucleotidase